MAVDLSQVVQVAGQVQVYLKGKDQTARIQVVAAQVPFDFKEKNGTAQAIDVLEAALRMLRGDSI